MKIFRIIVLILFFITAGVYGFFHFYDKSRTDFTFPVISGTEGVLDVTVADGETALLKDVTAFDERDGDLTDRVIVEQISNFIEEGVSNVTYAVVDNDNHVAKSMRRIRFVDYERPRFTFSQAMRFKLGTAFNVLDVMGAVDKIDGDLSKKIILTSSDLSVNNPGVYHMNARVTNSKGDVRYLNFIVTLYEGFPSAAEILLKDYLIYLHTGDVFSADSYIDKVIHNDTVLTGFELKTDSNVNMKKAGDYQADYSVVIGNVVVAKTSLIVVVEE